MDEQLADNFRLITNFLIVAAIVIGVIVVIYAAIKIRAHSYERAKWAQLQSYEPRTDTIWFKIGRCFRWFSSREPESRT